MMPQVLMVKNVAHQSRFFQTLLAIAWEVNSLRWEYDPRDEKYEPALMCY